MTDQVSLNIGKLVLLIDDVSDSFTSSLKSLCVADVLFSLIIFLDAGVIPSIPYLDHVLAIGFVAALSFVISKTHMYLSVRAALNDFASKNGNFGLIQKFLNLRAFMKIFVPLLAFFVVKNIALLWYFGVI